MEDILEALGLLHLLQSFEGKLVFEKKKLFQQVHIVCVYDCNQINTQLLCGMCFIIINNYAARKLNKISFFITEHKITPLTFYRLKTEDLRKICPILATEFSWKRSRRGKSLVIQHTPTQIIKKVYVWTSN